MEQDLGMHVVPGGVMRECILRHHSDNSSRVSPLSQPKFYHSRRVFGEGLMVNTHNLELEMCHLQMSKDFDFATLPLLRHVRTRKLLRHSRPCAAGPETDEDGDCGED